MNAQAKFALYQFAHAVRGRTPTDADFKPGVDMRHVMLTKYADAIDLSFEEALEVIAFMRMLELRRVVPALPVCVPPSPSESDPEAALSP